MYLVTLYLCLLYHFYATSLGVFLFVDSSDYMCVTIVRSLSHSGNRSHLIEWPILLSCAFLCVLCSPYNEDFPPDRERQKDGETEGGHE